MTEKELIEACFETFKASELPPEVTMTYLDELMHSERATIGDPVDYRGCSYVLTWTAWGILSHGDRLKAFMDWAKKALSQSKWDFSTLCACSATALPLAALLAVEMNKELIEIDNRAHLFAFRSPKAGERLVIVDSIIKRGLHMDVAKQKIEQHGAKVVGGLVIAKNDMVELDSEEMRSLVNGKRFLISLYPIADYYQNWRSGGIAKSLLRMDKA